MTPQAAPGDGLANQREPGVDATVLGEEREVLQVVSRPGRAGRVRYRIIKGAGEGGNGICRVSEFVRWARYRVAPDEQGRQWHRVTDAQPAAEA